MLAACAANIFFMPSFMFVFIQSPYNKWVTLGHPLLYGQQLSVVELACHHLYRYLILCTATQAHAAYAYVMYDLYNIAV